MCASKGTPMDRDGENSNLDKMIDVNLKRVYDSVLQEDVPNRFVELLRQLQDGEESIGGGTGDDPQQADASDPRDGGTGR